MHTAVTEEYNLVMTDKELSESNDSLPLGLRLSHLNTDCLETGIGSALYTHTEYRITCNFF